MNKCIFLGRMTDNPEVTYTQGENSIAIARFDFAVDRRTSREGEPTADFFRCKAFDRKAEFLERFGRKGLKLLLTGRMQNNNYTNKDGVKVYSMEFVVEDTEFAESKKSGEEHDNAQTAPPANQSGQPARQNQPAQQNKPAGRQAPSRQPARQPARAATRQPARQPARTGARGNQQNAPDYNKDDFMNIDDGMDGDLPFN